MDKKSAVKYPTIIGRSEYVDISGVVLNVPAKIDSGAFRSSVHCVSVELITKDNKQVLKAVILGHPVAPVRYTMHFDEFEEVEVTNSFGHTEVRYEVKLKIKLGPKIFITSFTLADRSNNLFPILIGRQALKGRFFIDVAQTRIDRIKLKKEFGVKQPIDSEDMEE